MNQKPPAPVEKTCPLALAMAVSPLQLCVYEQCAWWSAPTASCSVVVMAQMWTFFLANFPHFVGDAVADILKGRGRPPPKPRGAGGGNGGGPGDEVKT